MNALEHAQFVTRMNNANNLTDVMVSALMTGKDENGNDNFIQAGPKQVKALQERGLVGGSHYLTEKGQMWYRAFCGQEITDEERDRLTESVGTTPKVSSGAFLVDVTQVDVSLMIQRSEDGEGVSWAEAKEQVKAHFLSVRNNARKVLQDLPKLRKKDVTDRDLTPSYGGESVGDPEALFSDEEDEEESVGDSEALFSDSSETVDA